MVCNVLPWLCCPYLVLPSVLDVNVGHFLSWARDQQLEEKGKKPKNSALRPKEPHSSLSERFHVLISFFFTSREQ